VLVPPAKAVGRLEVAPGPAPSAARPRYLPGASYEEALAVPFDHEAPGPDLTNRELGAPLAPPTFLDSCGVPKDVRVTLRIVVEGGLPVGVTVWAQPGNEAALACVDRAVRQRRWPVGPRRDSFTTTF